MMRDPNRVIPRRPNRCQAPSKDKAMATYPPVTAASPSAAGLWRLCAAAVASVASCVSIPGPDDGCGDDSALLPEAGAVTACGLAWPAPLPGWAAGTAGGATGTRPEAAPAGVDVPAMN